MTTACTTTNSRDKFKPPTAVRAAPPRPVAQRVLLAKCSFCLLAVGLPCLFTAPGCQTPKAQRASLLIFPPPPAEPRIQFLTWASGAKQIEPSRSGFDTFLLGEDPLELRNLNKPYGLAARDGVVYVCDSKGLCLTRMDFKNHRYSVHGTRGPGRLRKPLNVVIDSLGYKFVVDGIRKQVVVFSPDDRYASAFSIPEPCHPVDLAIYENELYVLDNDSTPQIVVLDRQNGKVLRTFGSSGTEPGQFKIPGSLAIGADGSIYVSDTMNWRLQKLTREGDPVWAKGTPGYQLGQFGRPRGVRVGPDGIVYLVDGATELVQMFSEDGELLMHFGGPGTSPGALVLPSSVAIDTTSIPYFKEYVHKSFDVSYLLFVASQYGDHLISVYAFGSFPEGFQVRESQIAGLPEVTPEGSIGAVGEDKPSDKPAPDQPPTETNTPDKPSTGAETSDQPPTVSIPPNKPPSGKPSPNVVSPDDVPPNAPKGGSG